MQSASNRGFRLNGCFAIVRVVCWRGRLALCMSLLFAAGVAHGQVTRYVTPTGAGEQDGTSWADAYSVAGLQTAVDAAIAGGAGSSVFLQEGEYALTNQLEIDSAAGLTLSGGWAGSGGAPGEPGDPGTQETVLTRDAGAGNMRIAEVSSSTATFYRVTITDGYNVQGAGMRLTGSETTLEKMRVVSNNVNSARNGVGIYASGGSLSILDSEVSYNSDNVQAAAVYGGGVYASSVDLIINDSFFIENRIHANNQLRGGALFLTGGTASLAGNEFRGNWVRENGGNNQKFGGAIRTESVGSLTISNCVFTQNAVIDQRMCAGGILSISGSGNTVIRDSIMLSNAQDGSSIWPWGARGGDGWSLHFDVSSGSQVLLQNILSIANSGNGIYKTGSGSLTISNMLVAAHPGHGIIINNGSVTIANATIAENGLTGILNQSGAPVTMIDSIVWGNRHGGIDGDATVSFSNVQEPHAGTGNLSVDPLFAGGNYYLSVDGLPGQAQDSPVLGVGSDTAGNLGLDGLTTRTDSQTASGQVDLGYHHTEGMSAADLARLNLFVNASSGHDSNNDGLSSGNAFKTITRALQESVQGSTIHIAPGIYDTTLGESFPLVVPVANVGLIGSDPVATRIDAEQTARVLESVGRGNFRVENLTLENGSELFGSGLYVPATITTVTNSMIINNEFSANDNANRGVGLLAWNAPLMLFDSIITNNLYEGTSRSSGGGLFAERVDLTMKGCLFLGNGVRGNHDAYGGAIYIRNGDTWIENTTFTDNRVTRGSAGSGVRGGAIYADTPAFLTITNASFSGNYAFGAGSALDIRSAENPVRIIDSVFLDNANSLSLHVIENRSSQMILDRVLLAGGFDSGYYQDDSISSVGITNSLIHSLPGDGIRINAGSASIASTTLAGNDGWGLVFDGTDLAVENTIAWGNAEGGISNNASGTATIIHTASQEAHGDPSDNNLSGSDPLFVDASEGDYTLDSGSPAANAGIVRAWMSGAVDLAGNRRVNGVVDMGAYERPRPVGSIFVFR